MELLNCGVETRASKCLNRVFEHARNGNPEDAFASSFLYFEDVLPRTTKSDFDGLEGDKSFVNSKNSHLRYGLLFNARLSRYFGHLYSISDKANYFIVEATHLSQRCNDFLSLKLAALERCALEICSSRHAFLGRFVRNETLLPLSESESEVDDNRNFIFQLSSDQSGGDDAVKLSNASDEPSSEETTCRNYLSQQITVCEKYLRAISLVIRSESPETVASLLHKCLAFEMGVDRTAHSRIVREAARAAISTIQTSECIIRPSELAHYLIDSEIAEWRQPAITATVGKPLNTEATVICFVNTAYAYAMDGQFEQALSYVNAAKRQFSDEQNPMAAHHWMLAEACIRFDYDFFSGRTPDVEILSCFSPTEADFRHALLAANCGDSFKALKILKNRLTVLQSGIDVVLIIRCLILLGVTYCESGAFKSGVKLLQDALCLAESCEQRLLAAMARRRIAFVNINSVSKGNVAEAAEHLSKCGAELEKMTVPRIERGMYYVTSFKLTATQLQKTSESVSLRTALKQLDRARAAFSDSYPQLVKSVYEEGFLFGESLKNDQFCRLCKAAFEEQSMTASEYINWSLL